MALDDDIRTLARNPAFAGLEPDALRLVAFSAESRSLRAGDIIFRRNDPADGGVFILAGTVALDAGSRGASVYGPGTLLGESALLAETRRPATAIAREPGTVLAISRALFHRVLAAYPDSARRLLEALRARLRALGGEIDSVRRDHFAASDNPPS